MKAGEPVKWRVHFNQLIARPIPVKEYPKLAQRMYDDGLIALLTNDGIRWYAGRYIVSKRAVCEAWSLSKSQIKRFEGWVYKNDPFMSIVEEVDEHDEC